MVAKTTTLAGGPWQQLREPLARRSQEQVRQRSTPRLGNRPGRASVGNQIGMAVLERVHELGPEALAEAEREGQK